MPNYHACKVTSAHIVGVLARAGTALTSAVGIDGRLRFKPRGNQIATTSDGATIVPWPVDAVIEDGVLLDADTHLPGVSLVANATPSGFPVTYEVAVLPPDADQWSIYPTTFHIAVPADTPTADLASIITVAAGPGEWVTKGEQGVGIASVSDPDSSGMSTITYTDGSTSLLALPPGPAGAADVANATGILAIEHGGTGATTAAAARAGLGVAAASHTHDPADLISAVPVAKGGTGATTATAARTNLGVGSDAAAATASMRTLGTGSSQAAAGNHTHSQYTANNAAPTQQQHTSITYGSSSGPAADLLTATMPANPFGVARVATVAVRITWSTSAAGTGIDKVIVNGVDALIGQPVKNTAAGSVSETYLCRVLIPASGTYTVKVNGTASGANRIGEAGSVTVLYE